MPFLPLLEIIVPKPKPQGVTQSATLGALTNDIAKHPRITPQSNPPSPPSSNNVRFHLSHDDETETASLSSGEQNPLRGRTLCRVPATNRTPSRAWVRRRSSRVSIGPGPANFGEGFFRCDFTSTPGEYQDDTVIEPLPPKRLRLHSLSEELHRVASFEDSDFLGNFIRHKDTFAILGIRAAHNQVIELPDAFYKVLATCLDFDTFRALRLSCRTWSEVITRVRPIILPVGNWLPNEVLEKIYYLLEPTDFNAARHACRAWMLASLEDKLLVHMLHQGGWQAASRLDVGQLEEFEGRRISIVSKNWLLSKRLASECAFIPRPANTVSEQGDSTQTKLSTANGQWNCRIPLTAKTDFLQLATTAYSSDEDPPLQFTVSVCQKYLLVAKDRIIHIYSLVPPDPNPSHEYGGYLRTVTSISCPERVLAMSMDTSSRRMAVAALLQERIGLVCDIEPNGQITTRRLSTLPQASGFTSEDSYHNHTIINGPSNDLLAWTAKGSSSEQTFLQQTDLVDACSRSRSVYSKICSARDPPRSVAICPQRRCVAFGNSTGIELHWIDVLSGHDLQRWFLLSSASDSLYFLPGRFGVDSTRKLRLIASAADPAQAKISDYIYPSRAMRMAKTRSWDLQASDNGAWRLDWSATRRLTTGNLQNRPKHYGARPLGDGHHILFTDPTNSKLYLGGDVWPGQVSAHLSRRFTFEGPSKGFIPFVYTAGTELRWGVRIVAGYVQEHDSDAASELWLFTVPPDIFTKDDNNANEDEDNNIITLSIRGIQFAKVSRLADLAVDATDGDLTIHAFSAEGTAYTWQIAGSRRTDTVKRAVLEDGATIAIVVDSEEEDAVMKDIGSVDRWAFDFDDASSRPAQRASSDGCKVDADGDATMNDTPPSLPSDHDRIAEAEDEGYFSDEAAISEYEQAGGQFAIHVPPLYGRWSSCETEWVPEYLAEHPPRIEGEGPGLDVMGMTRLEVELLDL